MKSERRSLPMLLMPINKYQLSLAYESFNQHCQGQWRWKFDLPIKLSTCSMNQPLKRLNDKFIIIPLHIFYPLEPMSISTIYSCDGFVFDKILHLWIWARLIKKILFKVFYLICNQGLFVCCLVKEKCTGNLDCMHV